MENYIEVNTDALQRDIGTMDDNVKALLERISGLKTEVEELSLMWSGRANAAFRKQFAGDMEFMEEVVGAAGRLISCMEYAKKEYDRCEGEVGDLVASIQI